ncbi:RagB/SusD family nutrient uptake outer membrane protein [Arcticibacter tournemirensis]|uniref:RagB/SusD family nutrient uptake outer membrane protein n=1 Tax=Arcticibacter tournemirensis TaxID=699437 RepID=A0A4Q0MG82_9SPHI|nr:RagB/SusD family nutrient uptake outer membrane protein [Arcticibacter tournemirensis]RXF72448.1 RagB/SusD family nutrient uptake outer membrane protein [Arcticibacter tournemirensis]
MKKIFNAAIFLVLFLALSCNEDDFLNRPPTSILEEETVWKDQTSVLAVLGDLYNRYYDFGTLESWQSLSEADFNESFPSAGGDYGLVQNNDYGYGWWATWDYGYIRDLNLFIQKCTAATAIEGSLRDRFVAEARFLRASYYFELVKRMGGVPLILEPLEYNYSGDPTYLQFPRSKESEIYDFVISEAEAVKTVLPADIEEKSRATKAAALAMESRAALYAASIAKYGVNTPQVSLPGGEVGIPASMANSYYEKALSAAQEIISGSAGAYALYNRKPDLSENFSSLFYDKNSNPEPIFVEDFRLKTAKVHGFTIVNQPRYRAEEEEGGRINPSLNLVESFEKLDNTYAPLDISKSYAGPTDLFAGRDARLSGTVILPGTSFKGRMVDIWGGYQLADGSIVTASRRGGEAQLPGKTGNEQVVGFDGPVDGEEFTAQAGFYLRKYLDPAKGSGQRGVQSEVWFIRYRYAEVLLNAAEAAFELGRPAVALPYINEVRARAGFTTPLFAADLTFNRIVHERRVELAFEGHYFYDMKRWRLAHIVWDGNAMSAAELTSNIGAASKRNTQPYGLIPYKIYNPSSTENGRWMFRITRPGKVTGADRFRLGNYYSYIGDDVINNNPKIVRNPNQ